MRTRHRFAFSIDNRKAMRFLVDNTIEHTIEGDIVVVYAFEDDIHYSVLDSFFKSNSAVRMKEVIYEKNEIDQADWLVVNCTWVNMYPQPQDDFGYQLRTYGVEDYCAGDPPRYYCGKGLEQKKQFVLKKQPNWGKRSFMRLNWIGDELFVSSAAKQILLESDITGVDLYDVLNKRGEKIEDISQLHIKYRLPIGLRESSIEYRYQCPRCGFVKYKLRDGPVIFDMDILSGIESDIVKTTEKFGEIECDSLILISHRFYDLITTNNMCRGLQFTPVLFD